MKITEKSNAAKLGGLRRSDRTNNRRGRWRERLKVRLDKKRSFILSVLITYLLTIVLTGGVAIVQMDQERSNPNDTPGFTFYECTTLDTKEFIASKIIETIIPTTITFCATILLLQTNIAKKQTVTVFLFVLITLLIVGGIVLPTFKRPENLSKVLWGLGILCVAALCFAWNAFSESDIQLTGHKSGPCDGKIIF